MRYNSAVQYVMNIIYIKKSVYENTPDIPACFHFTLFFKRHNEHMKNKQRLIRIATLTFYISMLILLIFNIIPKPEKITVSLQEAFYQPEKPPQFHAMPWYDQQAFITLYKEYNDLEAKPLVFMHPTKSMTLVARPVRYRNHPTLYAIDMLQMRYDFTHTTTLAAQRRKLQKPFDLSLEYGKNYQNNLPSKDDSLSIWISYKYAPETYQQLSYPDKRRFHQYLLNPPEMYTPRGEAISEAIGIDADNIDSAVTFTRQDSIFALKRLKTLPLL